MKLRDKITKPFEERVNEMSDDYCARFDVKTRTRYIASDWGRDGMNTTIQHYESNLIHCTIKGTMYAKSHDMAYPLDDIDKWVLVNKPYLRKSRFKTPDGITVPLVGLPDNGLFCFNKQDRHIHQFINTRDIEIQYQFENGKWKLLPIEGVKPLVFTLPDKVLRKTQREAHQKFLKEYALELLVAKVDDATQVEIDAEVAALDLHSAIKIGHVDCVMSMEDVAKHRVMLIILAQQAGFIPVGDYVAKGYNHKDTERPYYSSWVQSDFVKHVNEEILNGRKELITQYIIMD